MDIVEKQIKHLESLRNDIRNEIMYRIQQRDKYSLQFVVSLATILALFSISNIQLINIDFQKLIIIAPGVSIYFSFLILYSYRIHYVLAKYVSEKIEPKLAELHQLPRDFEWENFYGMYCVPGIRKKFFLFIPLLISLFSLSYFWLFFQSELFFWLIFITLVYSSLIVIIFYEFLYKDKQLRKSSLVRDFPPKVFTKYDKAIFIDRDGTINKDTHYTHKIKDLELLPGVKEGIKELSKLHCNIIVVSNQAGIALGYFKRGEMSKFNIKLRKLLKRGDGRVDAFYYSPNLEPKHLGENEISSYYSKPNPGLLVEAAKDFELNLNKCFLIGDKLSDSEAGNKVGCKTILITYDKSFKDKFNEKNKPNYIANNFKEAVKIVKQDLI